MTFLEGILSFVSPCILPMVPVYMVYFAGQDGSRTRAFKNALAFTIGFSAVFIVLGVFAGSVGSVLAAHRRAVEYVAAGVIALLGSGFLFNLPLPFKGMNARRMALPGDMVKAFAFGMAFSVYLTPCVGAFLGAALMTAASEGGAVKGAWLLAEYSAGLAIPFIVSALLIERLKGVFGFFKTHARTASAFSGIMLIGCAVYMVVPKGVGMEHEVPPPETEVEKTKEKQPMEITLNAANFEAEVLKADKPVIVDFWATWCGPCRMLAPELEALAAEAGDKVKVGKVNVDENPELCAKYGIMSIPAIFVFRNGQVAAQSVGYQKKDDLLRLAGL